MMKRATRSLKNVLTTLVITSNFMVCSDAIADVVNLEQNWTEENKLRPLSYSTPQGSQIMPYEWFLHLELPDSEELLRSDKAIESLRFLPDYTPDPDYNPDGLPVGFTKNRDSQTGDWIGLNCSACHTGQLDYGETAVRIDGAPSMGDYIGFLKTARNALQKTQESPIKLERFAKNVLGNEWLGGMYSLQQEMLSQIAEITNTVVLGESPENIAGFGRLDAIGSIGNEVRVHDLGLEENLRSANAPVSIPFLWDTPVLDKVQWTGNAKNSFARNVGQVLGAQGRIDLQNPENLFESSVKGKNLFQLEEWIRELKAPEWPEEIFGSIDQRAAARGHELYTTPDSTGYSCQSCHGIKDENGQYPSTPPEQNIAGKQFIRTYNIPLEEIGTDPNALNNIYDPSNVANTGAVAQVAGQEVMQDSELLRVVIRGAVGKVLEEMDPPLTEAEQLAYSGFRVDAPDFIPPEPVIGYKARPLAGVWATAPYLHNGSVPNLYELLLSPEERSPVFWVGNRQFDAENLGFVSEPSPDAFKFDTLVSGNSNSGHLYGTEWSHEQRMDMLEYMKTL